MACVAVRNTFVMKAVAIVGELGREGASRQAPSPVDRFTRSVSSDNIQLLPPPLDKM